MNNDQKGIETKKERDDRRKREKTERDRLIGLKLEQLLEMHDLTQKELSKLVDTSQSQVSRVKNGHGVGADLLGRIADALQVPIGVFYGETNQVDKSEQVWYNVGVGDPVGDSEPPYILHPQRSIPLLSLEACAGWTDFAAREFPMHHAEKMEPSSSLDKDAFWVIADGSMEPRIERGDHILIEPNREAKGGDIVFIVHEGQAMIRRMFISDDKITLVSTKQRTPPIMVERDGFECFRAVRFSREI